MTTITTQACSMQANLFIRSDNSFLFSTITFSVFSLFSHHSNILFILTLFFCWCCCYCKWCARDSQSCYVYDVCHSNTIVLQFGVYPKWYYSYRFWPPSNGISLLTQKAKKKKLQTKPNSNSTNIIKLYDYYCIYFAFVYVHYCATILLLKCMYCTRFGWF